MRSRLDGLLRITTPRLSAECGTSENNRKARFYTLTRNGRAELTREQSEWRKVASAIMRVLETRKSET